MVAAVSEAGLTRAPIVAPIRRFDSRRAPLKSSRHLEDVDVGAWGLCVDH